MAQKKPARVEYWSLIEPVWLPLNMSWDDGPDAFVRLFRSIRPGIGHLYAAHWCQSEVCNGGLRQFFSNTTGLLAPEAVEGFRAVGAKDWAEILIEVMTLFGTPYPRDRAAREGLLAESERDLFRQLDERFFEWSDNWEDVANDYAEQFIECQ